MALNYNNIQTYVQAKQLKVLQDQIFNKSWRFMKMKENPIEVIVGGDGFHTPLLYAKGRTGVYSERGLINIDPKQKLTKAAYEWAHAYGAINISKQEEDKIQGDAQVLSLIDTEMSIAEKSLYDDLADYSYNDGTDSLEPHGAKKIFSYDRTLGGIDSTTYTWWDSNHCVVVNSNYTTTNLIEDNMINPSSDYYLPKVMNNVWLKCIHGGEHPTAIYASLGMYRIYQDTLVPFKSFAYSKETQAAADAGFEVLQYNGVPVVYDEKCPAGHMFFDNAKYNGIAFLSADRFTMGEFIEPVNQFVKVAKLSSTCQFFTNNPRYLGSVVAVSTVG